LGFTPGWGGVQLAFYHCDKVPEEKNLEEKRFILAHGFNPRSVGAIALGLK
jgi:hypothetical protein